MHIEWETLEAAFDFVGPDSHAALDLDSGQVLAWSDTWPTDDGEVARRRVASGEGRFAIIAPPEPPVELTWMRGFVRCLCDDGAMSRLKRALARDEPASAFRSALDNEPAARVGWYDYRQQQRRADVMRFLASARLTPDTPPPWEAMVSPAAES